MNSCLYVGTVRHRRSRPRLHDFRYRVFMFYLDLDELAEIERTVAPFSTNRFNIVAFHDQDYMDRQPGSTKEKVCAFVAAHTAPGVAIDRVCALTSCRILGYVFNPITLYYCHAPDGTLAAVVAEVSNTFGDHCHYLLHDLQRQPGDGVTARYRAAKTMHVSPFISMDAEYDFHLPTVGERAAVGIVEREAGTHVLDAQFWGRRKPLTTTSLARVLLALPLMTLKTITAIHLEALRLYRKGVPVYPRPRGVHPRQTSTREP